MATYEVWFDGRIELGRGPRYTAIEAAVAAGDAAVAAGTTYRVWEFDDEGWLEGPVASGPERTLASSMDFEETLAAMQGFIGERVAVGVIVHGVDGQFPTATMRGLLSMATEGLTSVDGGDGVLDGSINFILRAGDGDMAGWFQLAPEQFVKSERWEENPDRPLFIHQHGVAFSVHRDPL